MTDQALSHLHHCSFSLNYHLVLVTKYRKRCINEPILKELKNICERLCKIWDCKLVEFNGEPDHVHLLLELTPKVQPSKFVNNLKTVSSRLLRRDFKEHLAKYYWKPIFWSRTYCLITCGGAPLQVVKKYIQNQDGAN
jgi:putative transposase